MVSIAWERWKIVSQKVGSQADLAEIGPHWWAKKLGMLLVSQEHLSVGRKVDYIGWLSGVMLGGLLLDFLF